VNDERFLSKRGCFSMRDIPLHEVITAHTDALAAHAAEFLPMIRYLLLLGEGPVTPERLASAMRWTPTEVEAFLRSAGLMVDADGHVQTVAGRGVPSIPCCFPC